MEFLLRAMRKNRRRLRFEQWLLLAMRCLRAAAARAGAGAAAGVRRTRPRARRGQRTRAARVSSSTTATRWPTRPIARTRKTHLDQAKRIAKELIDRLSPAAESVAIVTAGQPARGRRPSRATTSQDVKAAIDRIEQSYGGTDLPARCSSRCEIGREESTPAEQEPLPLHRRHAQRLGARSRPRRSKQLGAGAGQASSASRTSTSAEAAAVEPGGAGRAAAGQPRHDASSTADFAATVKRLRQRRRRDAPVEARRAAARRRRHRSSSTPTRRRRSQSQASSSRAGGPHVISGRRSAARTG